MSSLNESMQAYKEQLQEGRIIQAYQGLMAYFNGLRSHFEKKYPDFSVPGNIYYGYMDMTYFAIIPEFLADRQLKIAVVFPHPAFRFEVWLAARNKKVQGRVWERIQASGWDRYPLTPQGPGVDAILERVLVEDPDFNDLPGLTAAIEKGVLEFIQDLEEFLPSLDIDNK
jgi:hypothetical protein